MPRKTPTPDPLLRRFLSWLRRVVLGEKKSKYDRIIKGSERESDFGRLSEWERFTPCARYTWRFNADYCLAKYCNLQIFLYCDSIEYLKKRKTIDTHRLSARVFQLCSDGKIMHLKEYDWQQDFEMKSIYGGDNCAAIVARLLATRLLHARYDEIAWGDLAEKYVATHRKK